MSFQPVVTQSGLAGWRFLQRTLDQQTANFDRRPDVSRDTAYFEARIGTINSAAELVADRRLLRVALGAFGLLDDLNNRFLIRKVLEDGVLREGALANRLSDTRYREISEAFGFGDLVVPSTKLSDFGTRIAERYRRQQFELAVGQQSGAMRLAMSATRTLPDLVTRDETERTKWFRIMGDPPIRKVFETALGLPVSFGKLDLEQQLTVFQDRARRQLGLDALKSLEDPKVMDRLVQRFLLRSENGVQSINGGGSVALALIQQVKR